MPATGSAGLVAPLARRRTQLKEKGKTRSHKLIVKRLPAGSGVLGAVPKGKDYASAQKGKKKQVDIGAYCKAVRGATETFKEGHRATSTAMAHGMYMRLINCWAERSGFGTYAVAREGANGTPTVRGSGGRAHWPAHGAEAGDDRGFAARDGDR